jgi:hypothetical protein
MLPPPVLLNSSPPSNQLQEASVAPEPSLTMSNVSEPVKLLLLIFAGEPVLVLAADLRTTIPLPVAAKMLFIMRTGFAPVL